MSKLKKGFANSSFLSFVKHHVNGGMLLMIVAVLAMVVANSPLSETYLALWNYPVSLQIGDFNLFSHHGEPLTLMAFINDALMAVFFFSVGLEIKREILVGELSSFRQAMLPVIAATGGMILPVIVYTLVASTSPESNGLAIPMATDIAFSLGVLSLLGKRVPLSLKIFLTAFAVVDDIGGILVIALFYTSQLEVSYLIVAGLLMVLLFVANKGGIINKAFYIIVGIIIWYLFLQSGIHSTVAGVIVAFMIPSRPQLHIGKYIERIRDNVKGFPVHEDTSIILSNEQIDKLKSIESASDKVISPLQSMENSLHGVVNYFIMPLFAFANAGVSFVGSTGEIVGVVTYAVALGLIIGKFVGIFSFTWLAIKTKIVSMPEGMCWKSVAGAAMLGGIGFTVALFIANLSFGKTAPHLLDEAKLGVLLGTIISGIIGYTYLNIVLPKKVESEEE